MSESDKFAFIPPTPVKGSEQGSTPSLRNWTIPKLIAELQPSGILFPATVKKAELCRLLFSNPSQPQPFTSEEHVSLLTSLMQIHTVLNTLSTSAQLLQHRMDVMEPCLASVVVPAASSGPGPSGSFVGNTSLPLPLVVPSPFDCITICFSCSFYSC